MGFVIRHRSSPIKLRPQIALQDRPPHRVRNLLVSARAGEFIEQTKRFGVRGAREQVLGIQPEKRVDIGEAIFVPFFADRT